MSCSSCADAQVEYSFASDLWIDRSENETFRELKIDGGCVLFDYGTGVPRTAVK
jgi:hypothetical protein